ncbi:MAG: ferredoxin:protochlorophyllide reductase (ATP-dependent) subunit B, partial [Myxococcota bacterium]
ELSAYQRKENWGAAETFYRIVRACCPAPDTAFVRPERARKSCNILGPTGLGFRHRDYVIVVTKLVGVLGVDINVVAPAGATPADLARLGDADFNVVLYPELAESTARWLGRAFRQPTIKTVPLGVGATCDFVREVAEVAGIDPASLLAREQASRLPWYSRSVDSTYLTNKAVYLFGDATHVLASARIATEELGFRVVGMGTYSRELARDVRQAAKEYGVEALITDDHLEVEQEITALHPELVLGTQMERHIAKRLGLPCAIISAPVHVHDYPARYAPLMGFEGANVIFDTWVHPLMMGLEEHLLGMFREDFEFAPGAGPSHLGGHGASLAGPRLRAVDAAPASEGPAPPSDAPATASDAPATPSSVASGGAPTAAEAPPMSYDVAAASAAVPVTLAWTDEATRELKKIPFFVRKKARRNTERFAREQGRPTITLETLYDAKAHFSA